MRVNLKTKTLFEIRTTSEFKRGLKKMNKQGKDISKLENIVTKLANQEELESKYKNHKLVNDKYYTDCNECHLEPDWLFIY